VGGGFEADRKKHPINGTWGGTGKRDCRKKLRRIKEEFWKIDGGKRRRREKEFHRAEKREGAREKGPWLNIFL